MTPQATQPDPEHFPSYRPPSRRQTPRFATALHKKAAASAFRDGADLYDEIRPSYPAFISRLAPGKVAVDIGAGTGKLTLNLPHNLVFAFDPSPDMTRVLRTHGIKCWQGAAEALPLPNSSIDAAFCAQAWHWLDIQAACKELDRVLRPGGSVVVVWNTIDVHYDPWILRLPRIMHSGDIQRPDFRPEIEPPWSVSEEHHDYWTQTLTVDQLHALMHSRSYWLRANEKTRQRMTGNLNWYLFEHMSFQPGETVEIPYRTDAFVLSRYAG